MSKRRQMSLPIAPLSLPRDNIRRVMLTWGVLPRKGRGGTRPGAGYDLLSRFRQNRYGRESPPVRCEIDLHGPVINTVRPDTRILFSSVEVLSNKPDPVVVAERAFNLPTGTAVAPPMHHAGVAGTFEVFMAFFHAPIIPEDSKASTVFQPFGAGRGRGTPMPTGLKIISLPLSNLL